MPLPSDRSAATGERAVKAAAGIALVAALMILTGLSAVASLPSQSATEPSAIVFAPWVGSDQALLRSFDAGYRVLRLGRLDTIVIVAAEPQARPLPAGSVLSLALKGLAGCLDAAEEAKGR
ncbi:hypothetical protein [Bosea sp. (in: a-proteobacteria)]|uniref:hypothetical protein n=1 Tax=Bosea sp. (in: a-proteobacteria) TaxID=1871050 RepID=UPI003B3BA9B1